MNAAKRQAIERKIVRHLIRAAKAAGWNAYGVDDGDGEVNPCGTEKEVIDAVFGVDEARIHFDHHGREHRMVFIVLGNDGYDCICDHSLSQDDALDGWNAMMDEVSAYCDKLECTA